MSVISTKSALYRGCDKLKIPQSIIDALITHAKEEFPLEACGILGGNDGSISRIYRLSNAVASALAFRIDPHEHAEVMRDLLQKNLEMAAFYHSHPKGPSRPSVEDIRLAFYPEVITLIISLENWECPLVQAFFIRDGQVEPVPVEVLQG